MLAIPKTSKRYHGVQHRLKQVHAGVEGTVFGVGGCAKIFPLQISETAASTLSLPPPDLQSPLPKLSLLPPRSMLALQSLLWRKTQRKWVLSSSFNQGKEPPLHVLEILRSDELEERPRKAAAMPSAPKLAEP